MTSEDKDPIPLARKDGSALPPQMAELLAAMENRDRGPLYQRLRATFRTAIVDGRFASGAMLPTERELVELFGVSRVTVRKAIDSLVTEGLLIRRQGAGTFVANHGTSRVEKNFAKLSSFSEDMRARGSKPESMWVDRSVGTVTPEEALTLGLSPGSRVYRFKRIRYADGQPMAIEHSTIPGFCLPNFLAVTDSLYDALDKYCGRPTRALQRLRAVLFSGEQADLLGITEGAAGLLIERRSFLRDGRIVEVTQSYYRADVYDFVAELTMTN